MMLLLLSLLAFDATGFDHIRVEEIEGRLAGQQGGDVLLIGDTPLAQGFRPHALCGRLNDIAVFIEDNIGEFGLDILDSIRNNVKRVTNTVDFERADFISEYMGR